VGLIEPAEPPPAASLGRVHFIGIGGTGMSGVARIMLARGMPVSGSETADSGEVAALAALGARVYRGQAAAHLAGADTVVWSTAIRPHNAELVEAHRRGLRVLHRAAALACVMQGRRGVAVAGTHGKTTTTSMLATALRHCGADPGFVIGGVLAETGTSAEDGAGEFFAAEADESDGSFLMLSPHVAVITSVEADHLDNYAGLGEIEAAFTSFAARARAGGAVVCCADDPGAARVAAAARAAGQLVRTYGSSPGADYQVIGLRQAGMRSWSGLSAGPGAAPGVPPSAQLEIAVPGRHNVLNAAAAYAAAVELGLDAGKVAAGLASYRGVRRRLEDKGEADGVLVVDSYAHHPTELAADLRTARDIRPGGRVIAVFQPHLYSRTRILAQGFGSALSLADEVIVLDVYGAREDPEPGVTGKLVADAVPGGRARFAPHRDGVAPQVAALAQPGDVVLTMGAGDVTALGPVIVAALRARGRGAGG
jgi:UDP-N-acetylmuramate--alanine ligase